MNNAERLLALTGGENRNLITGQGRELVVIPGVEHITILFGDGSHEAALRWLDATFSRTNGNQYVDRRVLWSDLHLLDWLGRVIDSAPKPCGISMIAPVPTHEARGWNPCCN